MLSPLKGNALKNSKSTQFNMNLLAANLSDSKIRTPTLQHSFMIYNVRKASNNELLFSKEPLKSVNSGQETQELSQRQGLSTLRTLKTRTISQKISCVSLSPTQYDLQKQNDSMFSFLHYCNKHKMKELVSRNQQNNKRQSSHKEPSSTKLSPLREYKQKALINNKCSNAEYEYKYFKITLPSKKFKAVHLLDDIDQNESKPQKYQIKNHFNRNKDRNELNQKINESIEWSSWNKQTFILKKDHILDFKHLNQLRKIQENTEAQKYDDQFEQVVESLKKKQNFVSIESERVKRISLYHKANQAITSRYEGFFKSCLKKAKALEPISKD